MKREGQHKACQNMPPKPSKTQPSRAPNPKKSRPGASRGAKMHAGSDPDQPRDAQECPRSGHMPPKKPPRRPKRRPSTAKSQPRSAPDPSKTKPSEPKDEVLARSLQRALFDRVPRRTLVVFCVARWMADMRFASVLMVFHAHRACLAVHARVHAKTSKYKAVGLPKPSSECPEALENRARSAPRCRKTGQERQKTLQDTQNACKKRPGAKNGANMAPRDGRSLRIFASPSLPDPSLGI